MGLLFFFFLNKSNWLGLLRRGDVENGISESLAEVDKRLHWNGHNFGLGLRVSNWWVLFGGVWGRQGDPLSPFLFLLAAEGIHVLMKSLSVNNLFTGYKMGRGDTTIVINMRSSLFMCRIILINSVIVVVPQMCSVQYYMLFGLLLFENFGKKEITGFSKTRMLGDTGGG